MSNTIQELISRTILEAKEHMKFLQTKSLEHIDHTYRHGAYIALENPSRKGGVYLTCAPERLVLGTNPLSGFVALFRILHNSFSTTKQLLKLRNVLTKSCHIVDLNKECSNDEDVLVCKSTWPITRLSRNRITIGKSKKESMALRKAKNMDNIHEALINDLLRDITNASGLLSKINFEPYQWDVLAQERCCLLLYNEKIGGNKWEWNAQHLPGSHISSSALLIDAIEEIKSAEFTAPLIWSQYPQVTAKQKRRRGTRR